MRRRLTLKKETLSELSLPELSMVAGGAAATDEILKYVLGESEPTTTACTPECTTFVTSIIK